MEEMHQRQAQGWEFRKTRLSEQFGVDKAREALPDKADFVLVLLKSGQLRFFTHASRPIRPGAAGGRRRRQRHLAR